MVALAPSIVITRTTDPHKTSLFSVGPILDAKSQKWPTGWPETPRYPGGTPKPYSSNPNHQRPSTHPPPSLQLGGCDETVAGATPGQGTA